LTQSLIALDGLPLTSLIKQPGHCLFERVDLFARLASCDVSAFSYQSCQGTSQFGDAAVFRRFKKLLVQQLFAGEAVLCLPNSNAQWLPIRAGPRNKLVLSATLATHVETSLQCPGPFPHVVKIAEVFRRDLGDIYELFEKPLIVATRPATDDCLHFHIAARQHLERRAAERLGTCVHDQRGALQRAVQEQRIELVIVLDVDLLLGSLYLVKRRLSDVDEATLDQHRNLTVEKSQQQGADVGPVNIRVGHENDAVISQF